LVYGGIVGFVISAPERRRSRRNRALLAMAAATLALPAAPALAAPPPTGQAAADGALEGVVRTLTMDSPEALSGTSGRSGKATSETRQQLVSDKGIYDLTGPRVRSDRRVRVGGVRSRSTLNVRTVQDLGPAPSSVRTSGTARVLVMLAHWSAPDDFTPAGARARFLTGADSWLRDVSYGAFGQTGDVTPWMQVAGPSAAGECWEQGDTVMSQAKAAAASRGFQPDSYDNIVLYLPGNASWVGRNCGGGWARGGSPEVWLLGLQDLNGVVHELGHTYGLAHAHSFLCASGMTGCAWEDYGDKFDAMGGKDAVMGDTDAAQYSAPHKAQLGWLNGRYANLTNGGTVTLSPLEADAVATQGVRVDATASRQYWAEYRRPIDHDSRLPASATDGIQLRMVDASVVKTYAGGNGDLGAQLLDARPGDGLSPYSATLRPGQSWTSPEGFVFTAGAAGSTSAALTVTRGPASVPASAGGGVSGDFNGDGLSDTMALYDYGSSAAGLWVFPGTTGRTDASSVPYRVWYRGPGSFNVNRAKVTAGDFNHDGLTDVLALYDYGSSAAGLWVFPGTTGRTDGSSVSYRAWYRGPGSFNLNLAKVTAGDFNRDGLADVLALYDYGSSAAGLWVFPGTTGRTDTSSVSYRAWYRGPGTFSVGRAKVSAGDFNHDGFGDLIALYDYGSASAGLFVFPGTTGRTDTSSTPYRAWFRGPNSFTVNNAKITAGDFNRDGFADLMAIYDYGSGSAGLWVFPGTTGRTDGSSIPYRAWFRGPNSFTVNNAKITAGDFNRDGFADVTALYDYGSSSAGLWVFPGTTGRTDTSSIPYRSWYRGPGSFNVGLAEVA
jgi:FG-GAP-like repeat